MVSEKSYDTAQRVDSQVAGGWSIPYEAVKPADETRTSTTLADDADMQFPITPGTYKFAIAFIYTGGAGTAEGDFKWGFTFPASTSVYLSGPYRGTDANVHIGIYDNSASITVGTNGLSANYPLPWDGILVVGGTGTLVLRWCKAVAADGTTGSRLLANSRMSVARRI